MGGSRAEEESSLMVANTEGIPDSNRFFFVFAFMSRLHDKKKIE
jgi:hypothetical protein